MKIFANTIRFYREGGRNSGSNQTGIGWQTHEREQLERRKRLNMQPNHLLILR